MSTSKSKQKTTHPSADRTGRFAVDALLRESGFVIRARPREGLPVWERWGELFNELEARDTLFPGDLRAALEAEHRYYERLWS